MKKTLIIGLIALALTGLSQSSQEISTKSLKEYKYYLNIVWDNSNYAPYRSKCFKIGKPLGYGVVGVNELVEDLVPFDKVESILFYAFYELCYKRESSIIIELRNMGLSPVAVNEISTHIFEYGEKRRRTEKEEETRLLEDRKVGAEKKNIQDEILNVVSIYDFFDAASYASIYEIQKMSHYRRSDNILNNCKQTTLDTCSLTFQLKDVNDVDFQYDYWMTEIVRSKVTYNKLSVEAFNNLKAVILKDVKDYVDKGSLDSWEWNEEFTKNGNKYILTYYIGIDYDNLDNPDYRKLMLTRLTNQKTSTLNYIDLPVQSYSQSYLTYNPAIYKHTTDKNVTQKININFSYSAKKVEVTDSNTNKKEFYDIIEVVNENGNRTIYCEKNGVKYMWKFPFSNLDQVSLYYEKQSDLIYKKEITYYYE